MQPTEYHTEFILLDWYLVAKKGITVEHPRLRRAGLNDTLLCEVTGAWESQKMEGPGRTAETISRNRDGRLRLESDDITADDITDSEWHINIEVTILYFILLLTKN